MAITPRFMTLQEFLALPDEEQALELWRGEVRRKVSPQGRHGRIEFKLAERISQFAEPRELALVFTELRATFGRNVFVPDISVYRWARVRYTQDGEVADHQEPPDIAIEIVSPGQSESDLVDKCLEYVSHGSEIALLVNAERKLILRFGPGGTTRALRGADSLDLEAVLPGLMLTVEAVFALLRRPGSRSGD